MKKAFYILILILSSRQFFGQKQQPKPDKDSLVPISFECHDKKETIKIPAGHLTPKSQNYEEGFILTISYPDSSYIAILCGANADLNLKDNNTTLFDRKEYFHGMTIIYESVSKKKLKYFEASFDKITQNKK